MDKSSLIYPLFVKEGSGIREEIPTMPGQYRYSIDQLPYALEELVKAGVGSVMFLASRITRMSAEAGAYAEDGIVQKAFREAKKMFSGSLLHRRCLHVRVHLPRTLRYFKRRLCGQRQDFGLSGPDRPVPGCRREPIWWRPPI